MENAAPALEITSQTIEIQKTNYGLMDKWFKVGAELRINRRQYIGRIIGGSMIISLFVFALLVQGLNLIGMDFLGRFVFAIPVILTFSWSFIVWLMIRAQSIKRCHDFGNDAKIVTWIITIIIVSFTINSIYTILGEASYIKGYISDFAKAMVGSYDIPYSIHQQIMIYVGYISKALWLIILVVLSFIKGNEGDNSYGKDPIFTKGS